MHNIGIRRWGTTISVAVLISSCGGSSPQVDPYAVVPASSVTTGDRIQRFAVDSNIPVHWGLQETLASVQPKAEFPIAVGPTGRYLVDHRGTPWRVQADAAWLMSSEGTEATVNQYLDTRSAQGFNAFYLMAMVHPGGYPEATHAPNNTAGDPPFATPGDFSTAGATAASERYWTWIDWIIRAAAKRHMVVMLSYTYLGFGGGNQGWWNEVNAQASRANLSQWGKWLGNRFKDDSNVMWFGLGDYTPPRDSEGAARVRAIADGIKAAGASQLFLGEASWPDSLPSDSPEFESVLDMYSFYGYGPNKRGAVYVTADRAWLSQPVRPAWMQEGTYEYDNYTGYFSGKSWDTRRGRLWSVLGGGTAGDGWGSHDAWHFQKIPTSLDTPGATASTAAFQLFATMPWWTLTPSGTGPKKTGADLVVDGAGTWGDLDYVTSARTTDHKWVLAYVPVTKKGQRTISVDMSTMAGSSRARWWDPANGNYIAISEGLANSGIQNFTTPGQRRDGTDDWLLVLDAGGPSPCGTITIDGLYTAPSQTSDGLCSVTATAVEEPSVIESLPIADGS